MSDTSMNLTQQDAIMIVLHSIRRANRAIERVLVMVDEDDIQRKFKQFLAEHETITKSLEKHIEHDLPTSRTPDAIIQFPISINDLLTIVAKSEKQIMDVLDEGRLADEFPQNLSKEFEQIHETISKNYDYLQALADIWS